MLRSVALKKIFEIILFLVYYFKKIKGLFLRIRKSYLNIGYKNPQRKEDTMDIYLVATVSQCLTHN